MTTLFNPDTQTPYQVTDEEREAIASAIDTEELTTLALTLGNIPSRSGEEAEAGEFVRSWLDEQGFITRTTGAVPHRQNIIGEYGGKGPGAKPVVYCSP